MNYYTHKILITFAYLLITIKSHALTVEQAYKAIPHERTVFYAQSAKIPSEEKSFLTNWFQLIDRAIVERVKHLQILQSGKSINQYSLSQYDQIIAEMKSTNVPSKLVKAHALVLSAIQQHKNYLANAPRNASKTYRSDTKVRNASKLLIAAYQILMRTYPQENKHNKKAFYDYLCALDFI